MTASAPSSPAAPSGTANAPSTPSPPKSAPTPAPLSGTLRLTGTNRLPTVRTLDWVARGFTKVVGDVEVATAHVTGTLAVGGKLVARQLELSGTHQIGGDVRVSENFRAHGTLRLGGAVSARNIQLTGTTEVGGSLAVEQQLSWKGSLEVDQDVRADTVLFRGRLGIDGTLSGRSISGEVEALSSVGEILADWVEIRRRKPRISIFLLPPPPWQELEVQRIEAKEVHLDGVRARYVKADRIFLGPDAHVEYVEGPILGRHKESHVGPESESPPPPGLSR